MSGMCTLKPESQGYYGNLQEKTLPELKDLLDRQKNLLKKEKFIQSLPDKGRKIHGFHDHLAQLVAEREGMVFGGSGTQPRSISDLQEASGKAAVKAAEASFSKLRDKGSFPQELVSRSEEAPENGGNASLASVEDDISDSLKNMKVSSGTPVQPPSQDSQYLNSYDRVIRQAEEKASKKREPFRPYCTLKVKNVAEMPEDLKATLQKLPAKPAQTSQPDMETGGSASSHTEMAESGAADSPVHSDGTIDSEPKSEMTGAHTHSDTNGTAPRGKSAGWRDKDVFPVYRYEKSRLISMEESIQIQQEQQQKHEVLRAQQAASRLASSLGVKMEAYQPGGLDMRYRQPPELDSDDNDEDADYAEEGELEELDS